MSGVNKAIIIGHLGHDPEVRYTTDGTAVTNFRVATTEVWNDRNTGEKREKTEWHRIVTFARLAENCGQYLAKGRLVYVEGRLQTQEWQDKEGIRRFTTEIVANTVRFLGGRDSAQGSFRSPVPDARDYPESQGYDSSGSDDSSGQSYDRPAPSHSGASGGEDSFQETPEDDIPF